jgi:hypothetical protein
MRSFMEIRDEGREGDRLDLIRFCDHFYRSLHYRIKKVGPLHYKIAHLILLSTNPWPSLVSSPAFHTRLWVRGLVP